MGKGSQFQCGKVELLMFAGENSPKLSLGRGECCRKQPILEVRIVENQLAALIVMWTVWSFIWESLTFVPQHVPHVPMVSNGHC